MKIKRVLSAVIAVLMMLESPLYASTLATEDPKDTIPVTRPSSAGAIVDQKNSLDDLQNQNTAAPATLFDISASTDGSGKSDISIRVNSDNAAQVTWHGITFNGFFDKNSMTINVPNPSNANTPASSWYLRLNRTNAAANPVYTLASIQITGNYTDSNYYATYYQFSNNLLTYSNAYSRSGTFSHSSTTAYSYATVNGAVVSSVVYTYSYDSNTYTTTAAADGSVTTLTAGYSSYNGAVSYFAYYQKKDKTNNLLTYEYATSTDQNFMALIKSASDTKVVDEAAASKIVVVYANEFSKWLGNIYYAKNPDGSFTAKMTQSGGYADNRIVVGAPDLLSGEQDDIRIASYQQVSGYNVTYGASYQYINNRFTQGAFGLNFIKTTRSTNGSWSSVSVSVDYPRDKSVTLDGKVYDIILADGKITLAGQAERLLKESSKKLLARIDEAKTIAANKIAELKNQIAQITKLTENAIALMTADLDSGKTTLWELQASLDSLIADPFLGDSARKELQDLKVHITSFLDPNADSDDTLAGIVKKYFDCLLKDSLLAAQAGFDEWENYQTDLTVYGDQASSAKTLEELLAIENTFPDTPLPILTAQVTELPQNPVTALQSLLTSASLLAENAKKEIARNKAAAIDLGSLTIPKNSAQGGVDVNVLDWSLMGGGVTSYTVLRREFGKTDWQVIFQDTKEMVRYLDKNIDPTTAYEYDVRVTSQFYNGTVYNLSRSNNYEDAAQGLLPRNVLILVNNNDPGFVDIAQEVTDYQKANGKLDPISESQLAAFLGLTVADLTNGNSKWHIVRDAATHHLFVPLGVYYAYRRGIPTKNIVFMDNITTSERLDIGSAQFDSLVVQPIKKYLIANNLLSDIESIVSTYRFPIVANGHAWESELNFCLWKALGKDVGQMNSLFDEGHSFSRINGDVGFLTTRIDAADISNARRMIDDSIWAEENYFFNDEAWRETNNLKAYIDWQGAYTSGDAWFHNPAANPYDSADDLLKNSGLFGSQGEDWDSSPNLTADFISKYDLDKNGKLDNTFLFEGWYNYWKYQDVFDWARGSIGWSLDSASANSFRDLSGGSNGELHAWGANIINRGATASLGAVNEPYLMGHTRPELFMHYILNGYSFAEASAYSSPQMGTAWMMAVNGDPLYTPFKDKSKVLRPTENIIENNVVVGYRKYTDNKWGLLTIGINKGYKEYDLDGNLTGEKLADSTLIKHLKNGRSVFYKLSPATPVSMHIYSKDGTVKTVMIAPIRVIKSDEVRFMDDGSIQIVRTFSNPPDVYIYDESGQILSINGVSASEASQMASPLIAGGAPPTISAPQIASPLIAAGPAPAAIPAATTAALPGAQLGALDANSLISVRDHLIAAGYFTKEEYNQYVEASTFDQVYSNIDINTLGQLLIDQHVLKSDITDVTTLMNRLKAKGIDAEGWLLRPDGFLSAIGDVRGEGTLFANDLYRDREILMLTTNVKNALKTQFDADHGKFVNLLSVNSFLKYLGAAPANTPQADPIFAHTWTALDTTNPYIVNPTKITFVSQWDQNNVADANTTIDYYLGGYWATPADSVVDSLLAKPEGERSILINSATYRWGSTRPGSPRGGVAPELDALQDANGHFVVRDPGDKSSEYWGVPYYYFPTRDLWVQVMRERLDPFVKALKDKGAALDYVILDYEQRPGSFSEWLTTYKGHYDLFFQDPRTADLLKNMGITKEQMMATTTQSFNTWWGTLVQLRWDKYVEDQRALAINEAFFEVFRKYFPDIAVSNWSNNLVTDLVPLGDYRGGWGLGSHIPGTTTTNDSYGTQSPIFLPTNQYIEPSIMTPHWVLDPITEATHFTRFNALMTQINETNSISAASANRTSNWVGNPAFVDLWLDGLYGANIKYDLSVSHYVSTDGKGGDGIGDVLAELWYRAAVEAEVLNFYNSDFSRSFPGYDAKHDVFGERTITEVNEMLGFSDRTILSGGWVLVNGKRTSIGPSRIQFDASPLIWGATANGKNLYRVVFDLADDQTREQFLVNDGADGQDVIFMVGNKEVRIPNAHIYYPKDEVSKQGFWVMQDPEKMGLVHNTADELLNVLKPKTTLLGDANNDGAVNISDITMIANNWLLTKNSPRFNTAIDLNHDGVINMQDLQIVNSNWGKKNQAVTPGDVNHDGLVDSLDIFAVSSSWGLTKGDAKFNPDADLNHDGKIDISDLTLIASYWSRASYDYLPGDVNHDGVVNSQDIAAVSSSWGFRKGDAGFNADADVNQDGVVNISDLNMIASNWS